MIEISRYEEKDKKEAMVIWNAIVHEDFFAKKIGFSCSFFTTSCDFISERAN